jgi:hypothetical protein
MGPDSHYSHRLLVAFIDDSTGYIKHGQFYETMNDVCINDALMKAIKEHGISKILFYCEMEEANLQYAACLK